VGCSVSAKDLKNRFGANGGWGPAIKASLPASERPKSKAVFGVSDVFRSPRRSSPRVGARGGCARPAQPPPRLCAPFVVYPSRQNNPPPPPPANLMHGEGAPSVARLAGDRPFGGPRKPTRLFTPHIDFDTTFILYARLRRVWGPPRCAFTCNASFTPTLRRYLTSPPLLAHKGQGPGPRPRTTCVDTGWMNGAGWYSGVVAGWVEVASFV
jgi:hypothetical protein